MNRTTFNKQKGKVMSLFPTPVVVVNIGRSFTKDEADCITDIPIIKEEGASNHRSKNRFLFDTLTEELKDIKKFCEHQLKNYLEEIEDADTNLAGLRITQSWLNKTKPQEFHHSHFHRNSYLSAVLYICCLPNDHINFENPYRSQEQPLCYDNTEFIRPNSKFWSSNGAKVNVKEGDLILFPSWVPHYVDKNNTDKERISLSFDTFPIGEMGNSPDTKLTL